MIKFYLSFKGNCQEVIEFYKDTFSAEILSVVKYGDFLSESKIKNDVKLKEMIFHAEMKISGTTFILNDYLEEMVIGNNFSILLQLNSKNQVRECYNKLKKDAIINIDITPTEFSELYFNVQDKFGINWVVMVGKN